jgi:hypothetical protein
MRCGRHVDRMPKHRRLLGPADGPSGPSVRLNHSAYSRGGQPTQPGSIFDLRNGYGSCARALDGAHGAADAQPNRLAPPVLSEIDLAVPVNEVWQAEGPARSPRHFRLPPNPGQPPSRGSTPEHADGAGTNTGRAVCLTSARSSGCPRSTRASCAGRARVCGSRCEPARGACALVYGDDPAHVGGQDVLVREMT